MLIPSISLNNSDILEDSVSIFPEDENIDNVYYKASGAILQKVPSAVLVTLGSAFGGYFGEFIMGVLDQSSLLKFI